MPLPAPKVVLFDMDGTLTQPVLDFDQIRADMGLPPGRPILEALAELPPPRRAEAAQILDRHERTAAESSRLNPGCHELLALLARHRIPTALITRNSLPCTRIVLDTHALPISTLVTREDEPYKPHPAPLLLALTRLPPLSPNPHPPTPGPDVWMVGDGSHDIEAAEAARLTSIWISHGQPRRFPTTPTAEVRDLIELTRAITALLE